MQNSSLYFHISLLYTDVSSSSSNICSKSLGSSSFWCSLRGSWSSALSWWFLGLIIFLSADLKNVCVLTYSYVNLSQIWATIVSSPVGTMLDKNTIPLGGRLPSSKTQTWNPSDEWWNLVLELKTASWNTYLNSTIRSTKLISCFCTYDDISNDCHQTVEHCSFEKDSPNRIRSKSNTYVSCNWHKASNWVSWKDK